MGLVEREPQLEALAGWLADARGGHGRIAFVGGEAGAGKSSLLTEFLLSSAQGLDVYWGACEPLSVARPLGPLSDMAPALGHGVARSLQVGDQPGAFAATVAALQSDDRTRVMVIEDIHWADESTLDFLQYLARRITSTQILAIVTFRDDGLGPAEPLAVMIGDLASVVTVRRLNVPPLSLAAVRLLVGDSGLDAERLYQDTDGNPFFVTEMVRQGAHTIPAGVGEAVLAQAAHLSPSIRTALDAAAVIGQRVEADVAVKMADIGPRELDAAVSAGLLKTDGPFRYGFRHELVRQAVLAAIPARRRAELHAETLSVLRDLPPDPALLPRLADHAAEAGDTSAVIEYGAAAAVAAAELGAHRESAVQYRRTLSFGDGLGVRERAQLLEGLAAECHVNAQIDEAIAARTEAIKLRGRLSDLVRVGDNHRLLSLSWTELGDTSRAVGAATTAVEILEPLGPTHELAMAYSQVCYLNLNEEDPSGVLEWGNRAIAVAEDLGDSQPLSRALNFMGGNLSDRDRTAGDLMLSRSLDIALEAGLDDEIQLAYNDLAVSAYEHFDLTSAESYFMAGAAYCNQHNLLRASLRIEGGLSEVLFWSGRWDEAQALCESLHPVTGITRLSVLTVLARIRARRKAPDVWPALDEALEVAERLRDLQGLLRVSAARAEARWLGGQPEKVAAEVALAFEEALRRDNARAIGELAWWLWRVGELDTSPPGAIRPFALQIDGDWKQAAAAWSELGMKYEECMAFADSTDPADLLEALAGFDQLEAPAARDFVANKLRRQGVAVVSRRPRRSTRSNPEGLTAREMEVLSMIERGMTDAEIARAIFVSTRTVNHHVSAILSKLGVPSRREAAKVAPKCRQPLS